jgi:hypothetical protein
LTLGAEDGLVLGLTMGAEDGLLLGFSLIKQLEPCVPVTCMVQEELKPPVSVAVTVTVPPVIGVCEKVMAEQSVKTGRLVKSVRKQLSAPIPVMVAGQARTTGAVVSVPPAMAATIKANALKSILGQGCSTLVVGEGRTA